jgi:hypothetical protein
VLKLGKDKHGETMSELRTGRPGAGIPIAIVYDPKGRVERLIDQRQFRKGLHVKGLVQSRWILAAGEGLDSDEEVSATIDRWLGEEEAARLFREARRDDGDSPPPGSAGVVRRGRAQAELDPTEGLFVPHVQEGSTILVGPTRFRYGPLHRSEWIPVSDAEISRLAGEAMKQRLEGYLRDPGTAIGYAGSKLRPLKPRELAVAVADKDETTRPPGWKVVVFRAVGSTTTARLGPAELWLRPYTIKGLNASPAEKEVARKWLLSTLDRAWRSR